MFDFSFSSIISHHGFPLDIMPEGDGMMKERIDRFALVNILQQTFKHNQDNKVLEFADDLASISSGWWLEQQGHPNLKKSSRVFTNLIEFILSAYSTHRASLRLKFKALVLRMGYGGSHGIETVGASVLAANQAVHHLAKYGGEIWQRDLQVTFNRGHITQEWLQDLLVVRLDTRVDHSFRIF